MKKQYICLSFVSLDTDQWMGTCLVEASNPVEAIIRLEELGIAPHGDMQIAGILWPETVEVEEKQLNTLFTTLEEMTEIFGAYRIGTFPADRTFSMN